MKRPILVLSQFKLCCVIICLRSNILYDIYYQFQESSVTRVMPVDHDNTGMIEADTQWDGGLQQYVQLLKSIPLTPPSTSSAYTTNIVFIKRYGERVSGVTGTLGSRFSERAFNERIFDVLTVVMPRHKESLFMRHPDKICTNKDEWMQEICNTVNIIDNYKLFQPNT